MFEHIQGVPEGLFSELERTGHEADYSPTTSVELKGA
jgi:hypothetical protein